MWAPRSTFSKLSRKPTRGLSTAWYRIPCFYPRVALSGGREGQMAWLTIGSEGKDWLPYDKTVKSLCDSAKRDPRASARPSFLNNPVVSLVFPASQVALTLRRIWAGIFYSLGANQRRNLQPSEVATWGTDHIGKVAVCKSNPAVGRDKTTDPDHASCQLGQHRHV